MKTLSLLRRVWYGKILMVALGATFLYSCSENQDADPLKGSIQFGVADKSVSGGRAKGNATAMVVSIKDAAGTIIHNKKRLDILNFGNEYLSMPLELKAGNYTLTEFFIVDENNVAISATPLEGSDLAYLVNDPAPISFGITKDNTTKVSPEVLAVQNNSAADFGYVAFSLNEVQTLSFSIAVFVYNQQAANLELTPARVAVTSANTSLFNKDLQNITNTVRVKDGFGTYHVKVTKSGYANYEADFTPTELVAFTEGAALIVVLFPESLADGLVAWYPFNGNTQDASGHNYHGTNNGATLVAGKGGTANSAYQFNGATYINVPSTPLKLNVFSYSMWVNASALPAVGDYNATFSIGDDISGRLQVLSLCNVYSTSQDTKSGWSAGGWTDSPTPGSFNVSAATNVLPPLNQWYHVVMVRGQNTMTLYVNNQVAGTSPTGGYPAYFGATNVVANIGMGYNLIHGFKGRIDNFRIYDRELTAGEIGSLFNE